MLQNYFLSKSLAHLITKDRLLPPEKRKNIVNTIVDFMLEIFGTELTYAQKIVTAQAAIIEFPGLEFKDGNPTVKLLALICNTIRVVLLFSIIHKRSGMLYMYLF